MEHKEDREEESREKVLVPVRRQDDNKVEELPEEQGDIKIWEVPRRWSNY